jgi:DNA-binding CsgD family transcriptional regulator
MSAGSAGGLPSSAFSTGGPGRHVLVVAADVHERRRLVDVLEREGFHVSEDGNGSAAPDVTVVVDDDRRRRERRSSEVPLVVVARQVDRAAVDQALAAGASGVVPESDLDERLGATVRAVSVGQLSIPAEHRAAVAHPILSPREKQVMSMVVLGFTNVEIATKLHVTETTVKSHLSSSYRKLRVRSRQEATALILSNKDLGLGILTLAGAPTTS